MTSTATPRPLPESASSGSAVADIPVGAKCCADVGERRWGFARTFCGKPAKAERNFKFYCGVHDPVRLEAKVIANRKKWRDQFELEQAQRKAAADKQAALEQDAARYRWAIAEVDNADALYFAVINNARDAADIGKDIDAARKG